MPEIPTAAKELLFRPDVRALLVVLGSFVVAKIVDWIITGTVKRLARRSLTNLDDCLIDCLHRPIFLSVVLLGLYIATRILEFGDPYESLCIGLIKSIAVVIWVVAVLRVITIVAGGLHNVADQKAWVEARMLPLFDNLSRVVAIAAGIYAFLVIWNLDVTPWLGTAGIVGIAIGFAAKDTLANLLGGVSIILDTPYKIGDFINLDSGERGMVTKIGLRSTRILTRDDVEVTIPNSIIANATIINESSGRWLKSRIKVVVGVAYGSDVDVVRQVLIDSAKSVDYVLEDPEPRVRFTEMADSALVFRLLCWISEPVLRGRAIDGVNTAVYKNLAARNIKIPFPQRELTFDPSVKELLAGNKPS